MGSYNVLRIIVDKPLVSGDNKIEDTKRELLDKYDRRQLSRELKTKTSMNICQSKLKNLFSVKSVISPTRTKR